MWQLHVHLVITPLLLTCSCRWTSVVQQPWQQVGDITGRQTQSLWWSLLVIYSMLEALPHSGSSHQRLALCCRFILTCMCSTVGGWQSDYCFFFPSLLKPPSSKNLQIISPAYLYKGDIYLLHNSHLQWLAIACCSWYWFLLVTSLHNSEWWCVRKTHDKTPIRLCSSSWSTWHVGAVVVHV